MLNMLILSYLPYYLICDRRCFLKLYAIPFNLPSVQVSKTDPSPKREMPTMILFNVVFALRVRKVVFSVFLHLYLKFEFWCCGCGAGGLCL